MANGIWISDKEFRTFDQLKLADEIATRSILNGSFFGMVGMLPDPDPILRKLGTDITIYKDLLADEEVSSAIKRRNMGVKSFEWRVEHGDEATDLEVDFVKDALTFLQRNKVKSKDLISQSLNPIYWGYSVFEIVWHKVGKNWLPIRISEKPREWFYFDENNYLMYKGVGMLEAIPITGPNAHPSMRHRFIVLQNEPTYENPYGDKALSRCFWPVAFKRGGWRFFTVFIEKYGMPFIVGKQPRGSGDKAASELLSKLINMIQDAAAVIPDDSSVEIKSEGSSGASAEIFERYINMNNVSIQKAILLNSLSMQQHSKGGYSSANAGLEAEEILSYEDRSFPEELFDELFISIVDLNLGTGKYPVWRAYEEEDINKELAERDQILTTSHGIKFTPAYYERKYKLKDDEFVINDTKENQGITSEFSEAEDVKDNKWDTNKIKDSLLKQHIEKVLEPVFELIEGGKDESVIMDKLSEVYPKMEINELQQTLAKVMFIAELQGRFDETK